MLGSDKVENYNEAFIKKLFERYQSPSLVENMAIHNQKFFLKFAKHWPRKLFTIKRNDRLPEEQCDA